MVSRPMFRYYGAKWVLSDWIVSFFPSHNTFVDVFGGSGAITYKKSPANCDIYNDIDGAVVNVFKVIRNDGANLRRLIDNTPYSRQEFENCKDFNADGLTDVERARRFLVRHWMSIGASGNSSGWRMATDGYRIAANWDELPETIKRFKKRFKHVHLECRGFDYIIPRYDSDQTLFYADPPYIASERTKTRVYSYETTNADHEVLLSLLGNIVGMAALSGYDNELYNDTLNGWKKFTASTGTTGGTKAIETLWVNPACGDALGKHKQLELF